MSNEEILLPKGITALRKINAALIVCDVIVLLFCAGTVFFFRGLLQRMTDIDTRPEMYFVVAVSVCLAAFAVFALVVLMFSQRGLRELQGKTRKYLTAVYIFHFWLVPMLGLILGGAGLGILILSKETRDVLEDGERGTMQKGLGLAAAISILFVGLQIMFYGMGNRVVKGYEQKIEDYRKAQNAETAAQDEFRKKLPEGSLYDPKTGNVYF